MLAEPAMEGAQAENLDANGRVDARPGNGEVRNVVRLGIRGGMCWAGPKLSDMTAMETNIWVRPRNRSAPPFRPRSEDDEPKQR